MRANCSRSMDVPDMARCLIHSNPASSKTHSQRRPSRTHRLTDSARAFTPGSSTTRSMRWAMMTFVRTRDLGLARSHASMMRHAMPVFPILGGPVIVRKPPEPPAMKKGSSHALSLMTLNGRESPWSVGEMMEPTNDRGSRPRRNWAIASRSSSARNRPSSTICDGLFPVFSHPLSRMRNASNSTPGGQKEERNMRTSGHVAPSKSANHRNADRNRCSAWMMRNCPRLSFCPDSTHPSGIRLPFPLDADAHDVSLLSVDDDRGAIPVREDVDVLMDLADGPLVFLTRTVAHDDVLFEETEDVEHQSRPPHQRGRDEGMTVATFDMDSPSFRPLPRPIETVRSSSPRRIS